MAGLSRRDRWIYSLYTWMVRFRNGPFNLSEIRKRPVRLLICLPSSPEEARKAVEIIPELVACLGAEAVFVAGVPRSVEYCDLTDERIRVVTLDQDARWWFGLPSPGIVGRLSEERLNLAVDLNQSTELLPAVLCLRTGAPIRLCLDDPQRGRVFNVQVTLAENHGEGGMDAGPRMAPDPARPEPSPAGTGASSGDSPYARMLRVVQAVARPTSHPRIST